MAPKNPVDPVDPAVDPADGPRDDPGDVAALAGELLRLQRRRTSVYADAVLDNSAFRLLWLLSDGEPRTLRQLADAVDLEQSTVNRQVNAALAAGYLERFAVPGSQSKLVRPSSVGERAYDHDRRIRAALISRALTDLGAARADRLIKDLRAFNDAWDRALGITPRGG